MTKLLRMAAAFVITAGVFAAVIAKCAFMATALDWSLLKVSIDIGPYPIFFAVLGADICVGLFYLRRWSISKRVVQSEQGTLLRASYVWHGEVMEDIVVPEGDAVTLGHKGNATFTIPGLGLPQGYAILRPGARGYVVTVGKDMTGTISVGGKEQNVSDFLSAGASEKGSFKGTAVNEGDWGVINIGGDEDHQVFFHFVKNKDVASRSFDENQDMVPAGAFSVMFHAFILIAAFGLYQWGQHSMVFPGKISLAADMLVEKPPPPVEDEEQPKDGDDNGDIEADPSSTIGTEGKEGGEGETERARDENPDKGEPDEKIPDRIQKGLLTETSRRDIKKVLNRGGFDKKLGAALARMPGPRNNGSMAGFGTGTGTGVGSGQAGTGTLKTGGKGGSGGGGNALGDVVTGKAIKTGGKRAARGVAGVKGLKEAKVKVSQGSASGSLGGLTAAQINKVVRSRKNAIRACYSRQLQRSKNLAGKITIKWTINSAGKVTSARVVKTTMKNGRVEDCIVRQVQRMKFPSPKGGSKAVVKYPFGFTQG